MFWFVALTQFVTSVDEIILWRALFYMYLNRYEHRVAKACVVMFLAQHNDGHYEETAVVEKF